MSTEQKTPKQETKNELSLEIKSTPLSDGLGNVFNALALVIVLLGSLVAWRGCEWTSDMTLNQVVCIWHDGNDCTKGFKEDVKEKPSEKGIGTQGPDSDSETPQPSGPGF